MQSLVNKQGEEIGWLYNNIILLPGNKVAGILLGHCAYSQNGRVIGKFFSQALYNEKGEIIARQGGPVAAGITLAEDKKIMTDFWEIMARTSNHTGPWIVPTDKWSKDSLSNFLVDSRASSLTVAI